MSWVIIGSDNGLLPDQCQDITWTHADWMWIGPLGKNFGEIQMKIQNFSFMKMDLRMLSAQGRPLCPGGDEWKMVKLTMMVQLTHYGPVTAYVSTVLGQLGSSYGLVPGGTKPLPKPALTYG